MVNAIGLILNLINSVPFGSEIVEIVSSNVHLQYLVHIFSYLFSDPKRFSWLFTNRTKGKGRHQVRVCSGITACFSIKAFCSSFHTNNSYLIRQLFVD